MCLLITQPSAAPALPEHWLSDFFSYNSDGVGVMYSENGCLITEKILPKTAADFAAFYTQHIAGKNCAFHLRMRTHGDTDLDNCHPYTILNQADHGIDMALMHNGILSTGNAADKSKSDTWHFIADYLRPLLAKNPDFAFHPAFATLIGDYIGASNKFVIMDGAGRTATINQTAGVFWGGLWLSNTYAWTAPDSTSKQQPAGKRSKQHKLAARQVHEQPAKKAAPAYYSYSGSKYGGSRYASSYYGNSWSDETMWENYTSPVSPLTAAGSWSDDSSRFDLDDTLLEYLEVIVDNGLHIAGTISLAAAADFAELYGIDAFSEMCEMLLDCDISEEWFINLITNPIAARQNFTWLKPIKQQEAA